MMSGPTPSGRRSATRRRVIAASSLGLATAATGCGGLWQGDLVPNGSGFSPVWTFHADDHLLTGPAIGGGHAYVGARDKRLYAVDIETGEEQWRFETGGRIATPPRVGDDQVFTSSTDGDLYALDQATGSLNWVFETHKTPARQIAVGPDRVYVGHRYRKSDDNQRGYSLSGLARSTGEMEVNRTSSNAFSTPHDYRRYDLFRPRRGRHTRDGQGGMERYCGPTTWHTGTVPSRWSAVTRWSWPPRSRPGIRPPISLPWTVDPAI